MAQVLVKSVEVTELVCYWRSNAR